MQFYMICFFFKQKTAYEIGVRLVGSEMCIRDSLYMIDMYRQHIETPMSIPEDLQVGMDFNAGNKYGRIYRIVPKNAGAYKKVSPDLRNAKSIDLVALLSHQNQWWRLQAQRLLLERQDKSVIPSVKNLLDQGEDPRFRLH